MAARLDKGRAATLARKFTKRELNRRPKWQDQSTRSAIVQILTTQPLDEAFEWFTAYFHSIMLGSRYTTMSIFLFIMKLLQQRKDEVYTDEEVRWRLAMCCEWLTEEPAPHSGGGNDFGT